MGTKYGIPSLSPKTSHSSLIKSVLGNGPTFEGFEETGEDDDFVSSECPI